MRYKKTFRFFDSVDNAIKFYTGIINKRRKAIITPWNSTDGKEHKYIVWFYE